MKPSIKPGLLILVSFITMMIIPAKGQSADEYRQRRNGIAEKMEPGSLMVLSTEQAGGGSFNMQRFGGYFYYLTGINEANTYLVIRKDPDGSSNREILFIKPVDESRANWDAPGTGIKGAKDIYGFRDVRPNNEFQDFLKNALLENPSKLYMDFRSSPPREGYLSYYEQLFEKLAEEGAVFTPASPSEIIAAMLPVKSASEIEIMRKAVNITAEAQREAMRSLKPGIYEYQLQALIEYVFRVNGAGGLAFPCIIGSGINSVILHWMENSKLIEDGDMVVVDIGSEYGMYGSDITRTYPASGKYTPRQKEIYELVLKANEEAIKMVAPGVEFGDISKRVDEILGEGMVEAGLIDNKNEVKKYYYHGLGHHIGLANARGTALGKLEPGMVLTIEPGVYIREEKLGVRIEDDVLVTETGYEVLSKNAPKTVAEIEKMMSEKGTDISRYLVK